MTPDSPVPITIGRYWDRDDSEGPAAALASCRTGLCSAALRIVIPNKLCYTGLPAVFLTGLRFEKIAGLANAFPDKALL